MNPTPSTGMRGGKETTMFKRLLGIAVFYGVATVCLAGNRPVNLITYMDAPDANDHEGLRQLATQYDAVILHEWSAGKLDELRTYNPRLICLLYKSGMGLSLRNNVESVDVYSNHATNPDHDDWFQTNPQTGERVFWDYNLDGTLDNAACRPDNPEWQQYWSERVISDLQAQGWDGVFADDGWVRLGIYGCEPGYTSDAALQAAVASFQRHQMTEMHRRGFLFTGNIGSWTPDGVDVWRDYMANMDAGMEEHFSPDNMYTWLDQMQTIRDAINARQHVIAIRYASHTDMRAALYSYCNALLVTDGQRLWYGFMPPDNPTRQPPYYEWYDQSANLGTALGDFTIDYNQRIATRQFSNGYVVVNPTWVAKTVQLPDGNWYDREGNLVTSVSLGAYTGEYFFARP